MCKHTQEYIQLDINMSLHAISKNIQYTYKNIKYCLLTAYITYFSCCKNWYKESSITKLVIYFVYLKGNFKFRKNINILKMHKA